MYAFSAQGDKMRGISNAQVEIYAYHVTIAPQSGGEEMNHAGMEMRRQTSAGREFSIQNPDAIFAIQEQWDDGRARRCARKLHAIGNVDRQQTLLLRNGLG